ncbi:hypothetical protein DFH08DRAFT_1024851 [Mycena albidolilacea]|uniref:Alpha-type protein kinase domain-containing protein n=1 Tax=Mycena albidolilacea TaxID=1033008 RepID=A0AAD7ALW3_9AGAR|nr:hypothetical protein DFH08DRAFT_1024851 [Mycena albidolilacea]
MTHTEEEDSGVRDYGPKGIARWRDQHDCNAFCKRLDLGAGDSENDDDDDKHAIEILPKPTARTLLPPTRAARTQQHTSGRFSSATPHCAFPCSNAVTGSVAESTTAAAAFTLSVLTNPTTLACVEVHLSGAARVGNMYLPLVSLKLMKKGPTWNSSQTLPKPSECAPVCLCHREKQHLEPLSVDVKALLETDKGRTTSDSVSGQAEQRAGKREQKAGSSELLAAPSFDCPNAEIWTMDSKFIRVLQANRGPLLYEEREGLARFELQ